MKIVSRLVLTAISTVFLGTGAAQAFQVSISGAVSGAQQWTCEWTGTYGNQDSEGEEAFAMAGFMFAADGGWVIRANATEKAGDSKVRAGCGEGDCWFEQKFGDDSVSYFSMKSTDKLTDGGKSVTYDGSWGSEEDPETHEGWIKFKGACKPLHLANPDDIEALMKKRLGWDEETY